MDSIERSPFDPLPDTETEKRILINTLQLAKGFSLHFVLCHATSERPTLMQAIEDSLAPMRIQRVRVLPSTVNLLEDLKRLLSNPLPNVVFIYGLENLRGHINDLRHHVFIQNLNVTRDEFSQVCPVSLVFWVSTEVFGAIMKGAPDFVSVRSSVVEFPLHLPMMMDSTLIINESISSLSVDKPAPPIPPPATITSTTMDFLPAPLMEPTEREATRLPNRNVIGIGTNSGLNFETFTENEALDYFLTKVYGEQAVVSETEKTSAKDLAKELGYAPFALSMVASYVQERSITFSEYLSRWNQEGLDLLARGEPNLFASVRATLQTNFEEVQQIAPASADLLTLSAFFAPDAIPMEIIDVAADGVVESISTQFGVLEDQTEQSHYEILLEPLVRYSLVQCDMETKTYSIHPLVQRLRIAMLSQEEIVRWQERVVNILNRVYSSLDFENWTLFERFLIHALTLIKHYHLGSNEDDQFARLCMVTASYLNTQGRYEEAEPLYTWVLEIVQNSRPEGHLDIAGSLNNLANLYTTQGRYSEAESLYTWVLEIVQNSRPEGHPDIATSLNNLASLYDSQGRYSEAEPLLKQALEMRQNSRPEGHLDIAQSLNNLASLYVSQGRYSEAEPLLKQALEIYQDALPQGHPSTAQNLNNLASLYNTEGRYSEAEPLLKQALEIYQNALPQGHPSIAQNLNNLAGLYYNQKRYSEAESLFKQALKIRLHSLPQGHPDIALSMNNLASLYSTQRRYEKSEPLLKQALEMRLHSLPNGHPDIATSLNNLGGLYYNQKRYSEAEPLYKQALEMRLHSLPNGHPDIATSLNNLGGLYRDEKRYEEAEPLYKQAVGIMEQALGREHPSTQTLIRNLFLFYAQQEKMEQAKEVMKKYPEVILPTLQQRQESQE